MVVCSAASARAAISLKPLVPQVVPAAVAVVGVEGVAVPSSVVTAVALSLAVRAFAVVVDRHCNTGNVNLKKQMNHSLCVLVIYF